jgi:hypothetical protein
MKISLESSVGIATGYLRITIMTLSEATGFYSTRRTEEFWESAKLPTQLTAGERPAKLPTQLTAGEGFFYKDKAAEAWRSPLTSSYCQGKKKTWIYTPSPPYVFMA